MSYLNILHMLGGLCLFLFGMHLLSDGLTTVSGGRLEQLLGKFCRSKLHGVLLGTLVTALIQSSSATTVMVVALANSGVMKLTQAVTVVMGANIGTTVTAWILSMSSISGNSVILTMLKPASFTPILALIGIIMLFRSNTEVKKFRSYILLGFAILMFGMTTMSDAVAPLQYEPGFIELFQKFSHPILGAAVGMIATAITQSSSASLGILQALSATGVIAFSSALPLIMGQNIGTCITAMLSSIGTNRNGKRVAVMHLSFNTIGTIFFMLLFYIINAINPFSFMSKTVTPVMIATVHTVFNVLTTALLLPFSNQLIKLSQRFVPIKDIELEEMEEDMILKLLDPRFLDRPGFALEQSYTVIKEMMAIAAKGMNAALDLLTDYDEDKHIWVEKWEQQADDYEDALSEYFVEISSGNLAENDSQRLTVMMHAVNDIERISDHSINLSDQARDHTEEISQFSEEARKELNVYISAVREIIQRTAAAFTDFDSDVALTIEPLEDRIDEINKVFTSNHVDRLQSGLCSVVNGFVINEVYNVLERVADHCSNIAIYIIQYNQHVGLRVHDYTHELDRSSADYQELYNYFADKYPLVV